MPLWLMHLQWFYFYFFKTDLFGNSSCSQCSLNPPVPNPTKAQYTTHYERIYIFLQIYPELLSSFNNNSIDSEKTGYFFIFYDITKRSNIKVWTGALTQIFLKGSEPHLSLWESQNFNMQQVSGQGSHKINGKSRFLTFLCCKGNGHILFHNTQHQWLVYLCRRISIEIQVSGLHKIKQSFCYNTFLLNILITDMTYSGFWTISYSLSDFLLDAEQKFCKSQKT